MQEQVEEKIVTLLWRGSKFTALELAKALKEFLAEQKKGQSSKTYQGEQTYEQLSKTGARLENIEISADNIGAFKPFAEDYNVDFALKRNNAVDPPAWYVFFKSDQASKMESAFKEFTASIIKRGQEKPSVRAEIPKLQEQIKASTIDTVKNKKMELGL